MWKTKERRRERGTLCLLAAFCLLLCNSHSCSGGQTAHSLLGGSTKLLDISVTHWRCGTVALFEPWVDFGQIRAQQLLAERDNTTDFFLSIEKHGGLGSDLKVKGLC